MNIVEQSPSGKYIPRRRQLVEIEADLRRRVTNGHWKAGEMIPTRRELAQEYDVDVNVIQRAVSCLVADKTLISNVGRGTFVPIYAPSSLEGNVVGSLENFGEQI